MLQGKSQSGVRKPTCKQQLKVIYSPFIICGSFASSSFLLWLIITPQTGITEGFLAFTGFSFWQKQESKCLEKKGCKLKQNLIITYVYGKHVWETCGTQCRCKSTKLHVHIYGKACISHLSRSTQREKFQKWLDITPSNILIVSNCWLLTSLAKLYPLPKAS